MAGREDIATVLAARTLPPFAGSRWEQMPELSFIEDRRPRDPLDLLYPERPQFPGEVDLHKLTPDEMRAYLQARKTGGPAIVATPLTTPGIPPMAQETVRDLATFAATPQPSQPVQFGGPKNPALTPMDKFQLGMSGKDTWAATPGSIPFGLRGPKGVINRYDPISPGVARRGPYGVR